MALTPEQRQKLIDAGYSASKINAYESAKGISTPKPQSGFVAAVKDIPSDIGEAFSRSKEAVQQGINTANDVRARVQNLETTPAAGTFQTIGGGLKAGARVVGEGFLGLLKTFTSPGTEKTVAGKVQEGAQKVAQTDIVQNLALKYASLSDEEKRNVDAAFGVLEAAGTVAGAGPAFKTARAGLSPVADAAGAAARTAAPIAAKAASIPVTGIAEVQGALTGTSGETVRQAFNAARRGGKELDEFTKSLRGNTTPEQLVNRLREGTDKINAEKSARFGEMLNTIGDQSVDTSSIVSGVAEDLKKIGVKIADDGSLDFSESKFRTVPQAANKLQAMFDEVKRLGDQQTVRGIDTSRQALGALLLTGDDASARTANLAITNAINRVRSAGKSVDGYGEALVQFGDDSEFLNEITRALSSGDKATIDTAYRKLATTLKTNNEQRRNLLMELDDATGGYILSSVAGQQLSEELPRGIFRQIAAGMAGVSVATGGISAGLLPALVFASPRVTGEVLRALGIAAGKVDTLLGAFSKVRSEIKIPSIDIDTPIKEYVKEAQPGLSMKALTPESVAKKIDASDATKLNEYLADSNNANTYIKITPLLEKIGIDNFPEKDKLRFIKEVIDLWQSRK